MWMELLGTSLFSIKIGSRMSDPRKEAAELVGLFKKGSGNVTWMKPTIREKKGHPKDATACIKAKFI
jgi:hypothetical protein